AGFGWDGDFSWEDPEVTLSLFHSFSDYVFDQADGRLVVFAAGDGDGDDPSQLAMLPSASVDTAALMERWITVAAVDTQSPDQLASYSSRCGFAMDYCLVAPGDVMAAMTPGGESD